MEDGCGAIADPATIEPAASADRVVAYFNSFARPFSATAKAAGLKRLVVISGGDAQSGPGTGPGEALQSNERVLEESGAAARWVRCGYFMENLLWHAQPLAHARMFTLPLSPDVPLALVAAADIGAACGSLLLDDGWSDTRAVEAYGPAKMTLPQAAEVMSHALDKTIRYMPAEPDAWAEQLRSYGPSKAMAPSLKDMFAAIERDDDMGRDAQAPLEFSTTLAEWASVTLAPAVRQLQKS